MREIMSGLDVELARGPETQARGGPIDRFGDGAHGDLSRTNPNISETLIGAILKISGLESETAWSVARNRGYDVKSKF